MTPAVTHIRDHTLAHTRPWLVVGKGPSSDRVRAVDLDRYNVLTLNHAALVARPAVAHFVDVEALADCLAKLDDAATVCLPWHPHFRFRAGEMTLEDWAGHPGFERLAYLAAAGRLTTYNATTAGKLPRRPGCHTVELRRFSAVAAFNLLILAGVRVVHSLGVDGGTEYGSAFDPKTKLANGQASFDGQLPFIRAAVRAAKVEWVQL